ncbi:putative bifunctional diguanylate cyclase/phosphodiesterase [Sphingomonas xanthus]|uniref:EAL domain-containing protein n=1 Tax=Sphingomonas xanthus TaxID=2594473 RepID=A0A516IU36_9SPHN|nr:EAL domain-containing protein [Sphingomonas xanthus]QDP20418.1 EAL domain-containing protein [Sphingomonas xanthus]
MKTRFIAAAAGNPTFPPPHHANGAGGVLWMYQIKRWANIDYRLAPKAGESWADEAFYLLAGRLVHLYLVVLGTMWVCAFRFLATVPPALGIGAPTAFTLLIVGRLLFWRRLSARRSDPTAIRSSIQQLQIFGPLVGLLVVGWAMAVYGYGDAPQKDMVHFLTLTCGMFAVLCLGATPFAGSLVACSVIVPSSMVYFFESHPNSLSVGIIQLVVFLIVVRVAFSYQRNFLCLSEARRQSAERAQANHLRAEISDHLASTDPLTGLLNRRAFLAALEGQIASPRSSIQLAMIDLDGFKDINDSLGHAAGDVLLQVLSNRLVSVYPGAGVGRLGGDEFAILFDAGSDVDRSDLVKLAEKLSVPVVHEQMKYSVSASIGLLKAANSDLTVASCLERADHAMYAAKQQAGPSVVVYGERLDRQLRNRQKLLGTISRPGFEEYLSLAYQPIVDTKSSACVGIEALARWNSPGLESLGAAEFIATAESCGQMHEVTRAIVAKAVKECPAWESGGSLFLNISGRDLMVEESMDFLATTIVEAGCMPEHIVFEITETALINVEAAVSSMRRLGERGFRFALDDFGSGQSSLSRVHRLPIDVLKIDGAFIENIVDDPRCRAAVGTVLELARQMQVDCVVEGIESGEQSVHAARLGARLMQGYYFARPSSALDALQALSGMPGSNLAAGLPQLRVAG